ncbi:MAG TPA: hypothetical protein VIJ62_06145 [Rhizomicrobium sp.]
MSKYGIGVGEEFPVDESPNSPPENINEARMRSRYRRSHHFYRLLARIALITLVISMIACLFGPHYYYPDSFVTYRSYPNPYFVYPHHFFFPLFSMLLVAILIAFVWRCGSYSRRRWHDEARDDRAEGA